MHACLSDRVVATQTNNGNTCIHTYMQAVLVFATPVVEVAKASVVVAKNYLPKQLLLEP